MLPNYVCFWDRWGNRKENEIDEGKKKQKKSYENMFIWGNVLKAFVLLSYGEIKKCNIVFCHGESASKSSRSRRNSKTYTKGWMRNDKIIPRYNILANVGSHKWKEERDTIWTQSDNIHLNFIYVFIYGWNIFQLLLDCEIAPFKRLLLHLLKSLLVWRIPSNAIIINLYNHKHNTKRQTAA